MSSQLNLFLCLLILNVYLEIEARRQAGRSVGRSAARGRSMGAGEGVQGGNAVDLPMDGAPGQTPNSNGRIPIYRTEDPSAFGPIAKGPYYYNKTSPSGTEGSSGTPLEIQTSYMGLKDVHISQIFNYQASFSIHILYLSTGYRSLLNYN